MTDGDTFDQEFVDLIVKFGKRAVRASGYMIVSWLLLHHNQLGLQSSWGLPIAFGILGFASSSARLAQLGLAALFCMALLPMSEIKSIISTFM
ncbi:hypothetical protein [Phyllobacterium sp. UNC302MFCol5.2]|uniref:hypothetical protein n=1 Tax=Phyllobacterium sp. UNC302MFCol5.2 TaxID=1449065 RepID=UPI0004809966|nr:hypothetical protein [Phyllobacterium sp. UNC302MFCol5.2]